MFKPTEKIWLDGKLTPWQETNVHILTHTLHYGVGVFEGIRYYDCGSKGTAVFRLKEHMKRFDESCRILSMKLPYSVDQLVDACLETVRANGLKEGYLRPLAFISEGPGAGIWAYDNPVRVAILTWGWGAYLGQEGVTQGIRARVSSYRRNNRDVAFMRAKTSGQYFNSVLAKREAKMAGCEEAILLDSEGYVAEGTGENIFLVKDGIVSTPTPGSILAGFTRKTVIQLLKEEGTDVREANLTRDDLYIADEIFMTGTAVEITPVREIDGRIIGTGTPGPITKKVQKAYSSLVRGGISEHKEWLTFVRN
jgi:branched-chain amino acid aminotransferase